MYLTFFGHEFLFVPTHTHHSTPPPPALKGFLNMTEGLHIPGWPDCDICTPPSMGCWFCAPGIWTCCMAEAPAMMVLAPGWPDWTVPATPGGRLFDRPFPKATAATRALVSAGLNVCLFCRRPTGRRKIHRTYQLPCYLSIFFLCHIPIILVFIWPQLSLC